MLEEFHRGTNANNLERDGQNVNMAGTKTSLMGERSFHNVYPIYEKTSRVKLYGKYTSRLLPLCFRNTEKYFQKCYSPQNEQDNSSFVISPLDQCDLAMYIVVRIMNLYVTWKPGYYLIYWCLRRTNYNVDTNNPTKGWRKFQRFKIPQN